jgi:hypothetical protein
MRIGNWGIIIRESEAEKKEREAARQKMNKDIMNVMRSAIANMPSIDSGSYLNNYSKEYKVYKWERISELFDFTDPFLN